MYPVPSTFQCICGHSDVGEQNEDQEEGIKIYGKEGENRDCLAFCVQMAWF